jgi:GNAT superfamily N-acetyltransferase
MSEVLDVRRATTADVSVIARHRADMFKDMGQLPPDLYDALVDASKRRLEEAIRIEEYVGWVAAERSAPREIIGGAGVQVRRLLPRPLRSAGGVYLSSGRGGIVLNVFTERAWRRRGVAELLMRRVVAWAIEAGLDTLVLHASDEGRRLYERLGFVRTNEMRYAGDLLAGRSPVGGRDEPGHGTMPGDA